MFWTNDYFVVVAGEFDRWRALSLMCSLLGVLTRGLLATCNALYTGTVSGVPQFSNFYSGAIRDIAACKASMGTQRCSGSSTPEDKILLYLHSAEHELASLFLNIKMKPPQH